MKFAEEMEEMELGILDINSNVYELTFREENAHGELTLIDLNASKTPHHYPFGPRTLTNFFDTLGSNTYRLFFLDDATRTVMEVTKDFVLAYLHGFDFETDMDKIDELNDLARELAAIREEHALPLVPILRIQMAFVGLLMNHTHDFEYHDAVLKEIVGIWQYNAESEEYEQVYPEQDTVKEENAGEDEDKENPDDGQKDSDEDKPKGGGDDDAGTKDGAGGDTGPSNSSGGSPANAGGSPNETPQPDAGTTKSPDSQDDGKGSEKSTPAPEKGAYDPHEFL